MVNIFGMLSLWMPMEMKLLEAKRLILLIPILKIMMISMLIFLIKIRLLIIKSLISILFMVMLIVVLMDVGFVESLL